MPVDSHSHFLRKFCSSKIELIRIAILPSGDRKGTSLSIESIYKIRKDICLFLTAGKFPPVLDIMRDGPAYSRKQSKVVEIVRGQWKIVGCFPSFAFDHPSAPTIARIPSFRLDVSLFLSYSAVLSVVSSSLSVSLLLAVSLFLSFRLCLSLSLLLARSARS